MNEPVSLRALRLGRTLAAFVDVLIPGDELFPAASEAGTHGIVLGRVRQQFGEAGYERIASGLGEGFAGLDAAGRAEALAAFQQGDPELFAFLRMATYLAYYETPPAIAALRALGHDYNDAPQPLGYELPPFDPSKHLPASPRGSYKRTEEIVRVDLSALAGLGLPVAGGGR